LFDDESLFDESFVESELLFDESFLLSLSLFLLSEFSSLLLSELLFVLSELSLLLLDLSLLSSELPPSVPESVLSFLTAPALLRYFFLGILAVAFFFGDWSFLRNDILSGSKVVFLLFFLLEGKLLSSLF